MTTIIQAAQLIADIDPALANAFVNQPFQRHNLVTAFYESLQGTAYQEMSDHIAVFLRSAIDQAQANYSAK